MSNYNQLPIEQAIYLTIAEYFRAGWLDTVVMAREMIHRVMRKFRLTSRQAVTQIRNFLAQ